MINKNTLKYLLITTLFMTPVLTSAALGGVKGLLNAVGGLINSVIPVIFGLAMIYFFWGVGQFILKAGDQKAREEGKQRMIWGVVALFAMFSIYGILRFIGNAIDIPVPSGGGSNPSGFLPPPGTLDA